MMIPDNQHWAIFMNMNELALTSQVEETDQTSGVFLIAGDPLKSESGDESILFIYIRRRIYP